MSYTLPYSIEFRVEEVNETTLELSKSQRSGVKGIIGGMYIHYHYVNNLYIN